ncbi:MAG: hypothetical protein NVSMB1_05650 [Polyangiales bacterium]
METIARVAIAIALFFCLLCALAPPALADGTVVLWHAYRGAEEEALAEVLAHFRAAHPGAVVESLAIPFDAYASKLEAAIPHGHGPDVFLDAHERIASYRERGLIARVDDTVVDRDIFDDAVLQAVTLDNQLYGVPFALKCLALYLRPPTWSSSRAPSSLQEFVGMARAQGIPTLAYEASDAYQHAPILHAFGGQIVDTAWFVSGDSKPPSSPLARLSPGNTARSIAPSGASFTSSFTPVMDRYAFADGPAEQSLSWVVQAIEAKAIPEEASGALVTQLFQNGSANAGTDAAISGPWLGGELSRGLEYHVVPIPKVVEGGAQSRPFLTVEAVMLAPHPRDRALANALVRWMVGREASIVRATIGRQIVATRDAWTNPALANDPLLAGFRQAASVSVPMPTSKAMRAAWEPTTRAIQKVIRGDLSPHDAILEAAHRFADVTRPLPKARDPLPLMIAVGVIALFFAVRAVHAARDPALHRALRQALPAYAYVAHAVIILLLLVVAPLLIGASASLFAGRDETSHYVGFGNFIEILTARGGPLFASGSFYAVLAVTILWTVTNVCLHLVIGVSLALLLSRPLLRLRGMYRVLLIVPWAVPSYVSALSWKGMFHRQLGAVNAMLALVGVEPIAWFSRFATAFAANVTTNVWLGFPFMMVVTLGALSAIPREVLEAAEVDGATRWQRFFRVTLPLIRPTLAPSVVLGAVWTFNMFNVVFLVSGGEPDGRTEILVSEAYRWAFTRQAQYGYASAYAVLIFILLATTTRLLRRQSAPI